jgi:PAS domain S-box-containing protein
MRTTPRLGDHAVFRRTLTRSLVLPLVLLLALAGIFLWQVNSLLSATQLVDRTDQTIAQAHLVRELLLDQETGLRGYLIAGDTDFLEPYERGATGMAQAFDTLARQLADRPGQLAMVEDLRTQYAQWSAYARDVIALRDSGGDYQATVRQRTGKRLTDLMRSRITSIIVAEEQLRNERTRMAQQTTLLVVGSSVAGALVLGLLLVFFVRRQLLALSQSYEGALAASREGAAALARSEEQFRLLAEAAPQLIWITRPDGYHEYFNQRWYDYTGTTLEQTRGEGWSHLLHPEDLERTLEVWQHSLRTGDPYEIEYRFKEARTGEYRWFLGRALPARDDKGAITRWFGTCTDIDDQKRSAEALQERTEELAGITASLEERNRELDQFAYVTSHDLKAPLRGIANLSQWIEEDLGEQATEDIRKQLDLLRGRVNRMEGLIDGILQYSRIGRVQGDLEPVEVGELLRDVVDLLGVPPEFTVEIGPGMPTITTERVRLQQVFSNLIGNAVKHRSRPDGHVCISTTDEHTMYEFAVADDGPGIAPQYHDRIFVIFQTLASRDTVEGSGLGLSLVKKIVESQGGRIWVESAEGAGATFHFTWPKHPRKKRR